MSQEGVHAKGARGSFGNCVTKWVIVVLALGVVHRSHAEPAEPTPTQSNIRVRPLQAPAEPSTAEPSTAEPSTKQLGSAPMGTTDPVMNADPAINLSATDPTRVSLDPVEARAAVATATSSNPSKSYVKPLGKDPEHVKEPVEDRDPFALLPLVIPREKLGPLRGIRPRANDDAPEGDPEKPSRIRTMVRTRPSGALVLYHGKRLGYTPVSIPGTTNDTPMDLVIKRKGHMTLRTRIIRERSRTYVFKLAPAKIQ